MEMKRSAFLMSLLGFFGFQRLAKAEPAGITMRNGTINENATLAGVNWANKSLSEIYSEIDQGIHDKFREEIAGCLQVPMRYLWPECKVTPLNHLDPRWPALMERKRPSSDVNPFLG
jgi:hypothetical protein